MVNPSGPYPPPPGQTRPSPGERRGVRSTHLDHNPSRLGLVQHDKDEGAVVGIPRNVNARSYLLLIVKRILCNFTVTRLKDVR